MIFGWRKKKKEKVGKVDEKLDEKVDNNIDTKINDEINKVDEENIVETNHALSLPKQDQSPKKKRVFARLKERLSKTRMSMKSRMSKLFSDNMAMDAAFLEQLEEFLITSDIGVDTTMKLIDKLKQSISSGQIKSGQAIKAFLEQSIIDMFSDCKPDMLSYSNKPHVILVVGVNGTGKTTTIGKLAAKFVENGKRVIIAASDTFRAAAVEQLTIWAERSGAEIVKHRENADPAAVAFDALEAGVARKADIVLVDTAGRLHTKVNLMEELKKILRTISRRIPGAPHETLLVLDATFGQNSISQAKLFNEALKVTGLVLTKLDGTAKGGVVISIYNELGIPIKYIGVGEQIEDLQEFQSDNFVRALFEEL